MATTTGNAKNIQEAAGHGVERAKDAASSALDKAKDVAKAAGDKAKDVAKAATDKAKDMAHTAGDYADSATAKVGGGMESLAGTIREHTPHEGVIGGAASKVADGLESAGKYLEKEGLTGMASDLTDVIKRNPIPALLIGIGLGFLLSRATSRS